MQRWFRGKAAGRWRGRGGGSEVVRAHRQTQTGRCRHADRHKQKVANGNERSVAPCGVHGACKVANAGCKAAFAVLLHPFHMLAYLHSAPPPPKKKNKKKTTSANPR